MLFSEIQPFVRFPRFMTVTSDAPFSAVYPYDHRFFIVIDGKASIVVENTVYEMEKGAVLLIPSATEYVLRSATKSCVFLAVNFDYFYSPNNPIEPIPPVCKKEFNANAVWERACFTDAAFLNTTLCLNNMERLENNLFRMQREFSEKRVHYERLISHLFCDTLIDCAREYAALAAPYQCKKSTEILKYIQEHFSDNTLSNQKLSSIFFLHKNYINQIVKAETGISLHQYLLSVRIANAVALLETGRYDVQTVAEKCGFNDIYHFSSYFKRALGVPPSHYKGK